ncbi:NAD(P)/FAD-dependent oxidoreductase, partial [Clostridium uliginosum]
IIERDVIVVGAGPGGSICASYLARAGVDVLLIDKEVFPRDKPCADAQSGNTLKHVKELGALEELKPLAMIEHKIKMVSSEYVETTIDTDTATAYITPRWIFDDLMKRNAVRLGAECWEDCWVYDVIKEDDYVVGVKAKYQGEYVEIRSKIVIGADGSHSVVAKSVGMFPEYSGSIAPALRTYFTGVELDPELKKEGYIEFHFDASVAPAYIWVFPSGVDGLSKGFCNVGLGVADRDSYANQSLEEIFNKWVEDSPYGKRFKNATQVAPWKGWRVPDAHQRLRNCGNGFMLIGDAGSTVIPLVDEGISAAADSGKFAADAAIEALKENNFSDEFLFERYPKKFSKMYDDRIKTIKLVQESMYDPNITNMLVNKFNSDKAFKDAAFGKMFRK